MNASVLRSTSSTDRSFRAASPLWFLLAAGCVVLALLTSLVPPAKANIGGDRFWAGEVYSGEIGAPSLLRVGSTYYAYATNTDGHNLPVMTSSNLETWRARKAWPVSAGYSTWKGYNDAMPFPATWAAKMSNGKPANWAPAVAYLAGRYVNAHAVQMRHGSARHCLTLATSPKPDGPFRNSSSKPFYCSSDPNGSIDPAWMQVGGKVYLIWKNAGIKGSKPTEIMARQMRPGGMRFARDSRARVLLRTQSSWEGNVIEAPAMIRYAGRYYLFYSGNHYATDRYAIGYATCTGPLGPCQRASTGPLLATDDVLAGPGAQSPIVDQDGRLRLAYSAWRTGHVGYPTSKACLDTAAGCNQRRMYIATLAAAADGTLSVTDPR